MIGKRIFISLVLPEDLKSQIVSFQKSLDERLFRNVPRENLHITLVFLGHIKNESEIKQTGQELRDILKEVRTFPVKSESFELGPTNSNPRLIWLKISSPHLISVSRLLQDKLLEGRFKETRPFRGHITVARLKNRKSWFLKRADFKSLAFPSEFYVDTVELKESILSREGARYKTIDSFHLK